MFPQRFGQILFFLFIASLISVAAQAETRRQPNFILILMDDMGWRDVGFMGNKFVETPNIDRLRSWFIRIP